MLSTSGCHLCDQAHEMVNYLIAKDSEIAATLHFEVKDIADDDALVERYGIRIPVLRYLSKEPGLTKELNWPFELEELSDWLVD